MVACGGHDVHHCPQGSNLVHWHPGLETKELGYFCPGLCPSLVKASGIGEGMRQSRQSRCLREVGVGGGQNAEF